MREFESLDPNEKEKEDTAATRVREMLEANRNLVNNQEYLASLATLTAVELAQKEIDKEKGGK